MSVASRRRPRSVCAAEFLEPRRLFATIAWANSSGGDFGTPTNWVGNVVPGPNDDAVINLPGFYSVAVTSPQAARSVTIDASNVTSGQSLALYVYSSLTTTAGTNLAGPAFLFAQNNATINGNLNVNNTDNTYASIQDSTVNGTLSASGSVFLMDATVSALSTTTTASINVGAGTNGVTTTVGDGFTNNGSLLLTTDASSPAATTLSVGGSATITNSSTGTLTAATIADANGHAFADVVNASIVNDGTLSIEGALTVLRSFNQSLSGVLNFYDASSTDPTLLTVFGTSLLQGAANASVLLPAGGGVALGQNFTLATFLGGSTGSVATTGTAADGTTPYGLDVQFTSGSLTATVVPAGSGGGSGGGGTTGGATLAGGTLTATGSAGDDVASITSDGTNVTFTVNGTSQSFALSQITDIQINLGAGNDRFTAGGAGLPGLNVFGGPGNDTLGGGPGRDTLRGGKGNDSLVGGRGNDLLSGDNGADSASGGSGNDTLVSELGDDNLFGGVGNDIFVNAGGVGDTVNGGAGFNFAREDAADALLNITLVYDPSAPLTLADLEAGKLTPEAVVARPSLSTALAISVVNGVLTVTGTAGDDAVTLTQTGNTLLLSNGGAAATPFDLSAVNAVRLSLGDGNDLLDADASVTVPVVADGGNGNDTLRGGSGADSLLGGAGDDALVGRVGQDTLLGGDGNDTLRGLRGADSLDGGAGDDFLVGGTGADSLLGGDGNDVLTPGVRYSTNGGDNGADLLAGGPGQDTAVYVYRLDNLTLKADGSAASGGAGEGDAVDADVENLLGGEGNDTITGTADAGGFLSGGVGADAVAGGAFNDNVVGCAGADSVGGGAGHNGVFLRQSPADGDLYVPNGSLELTDFDGLDASTS